METYEVELQQAERLSALVYLENLEPGLVGDIAGKIEMEETIWPCRMSRKEWLKVLHGIQQDENISSLNLIKIDDKPTGHRGVVFSDGNGKGFIIFRGTNSALEWEDNALGMLEPDTPAQQLASAFVWQEYRNFQQTIVAGHSKGGNKAKYSAITLPDYCIERCYSFDGQGFSLEFIEKYKESIAKRKQIIKQLSDRRGFVNALGLPVVETTYLNGWRGAARIDLPYGDSIEKFHCPDALRDVWGKLATQSRYSPIPLAVAYLARHFLSSPQYEAVRKNTVLGLVSFMEQNKKDQAAVAQLLLVFTDLCSYDLDFRQLITDIILQETDVILATSSAFSEENNKIYKSLARLLILNRKGRQHFIESVRFFKSLRAKYLSGKQQRLNTHIDEAIHLIATESGFAEY